MIAMLAALLLAAPGRNEEARELYEQAQVEFDLGKYKDAIAKWEAAYRRKPVPQALYNMGQAYFRLGQLEEAARAFKTFIAKIKSGKQVELAKQRLTQVEEALKAKAAASSAPGEQMVTVGVAPLRTEGLSKDLAWMGKSFADALLAALQRSRAVRVVEREFLDQVMAEMKLQTSSLVDERTAVQVGRILGAKAMVFGSVAMFGEEMMVRARIVSVERAELVGNAEAQGPTKQLFALQKQLAKQVASAMALSAAIGESGLEVTEMSLGAYADLDRLRALARGLPYLGLDPARRRKQADQQLASSLADKLLAQHPKLAPAHLYRGMFALQAEDFDRAEQEAAAAVRLSPEEPEARQLEGNVKFARGDLGGALRVFRDMTERWPDDARAWYAVGRIAAAQGDKSGGAMALLAALQRAPFIAEAESNLRALIGTGPAVVKDIGAQDPAAGEEAALFQDFFAGRRAAAERAANVVKSAPRLYLGHYMQGVSGGGEPPLRRAIEARPAFPEAHRELGRVLLEQKRCAEGSQHVSLYMKNATAVDDFAPLEQAMSACRGGT